MNFVSSFGIISSLVLVLDGRDLQTKDKMHKKSQKSKLQDATADKTDRFSKTVKRFSSCERL